MTGSKPSKSSLPALLTAAERLIRPIKVKEPQIEAGRAKPIEEISAIDLSSDLSIFGSEGSPTWVTEIRSLARTREVEFIEGATADEKASRLVERLTQARRINQRRREAALPASRPRLPPTFPPTAKCGR